MSKNRSYLFAVSLLVLAILACNFQAAGTPVVNPGAAGTAVAQTVTALVQPPAPASPATDTPASTTVSVVTDTSAPATLALSTDTPLPPPTQVCDSAQFISETIPDGTTEIAGVPFTKTWRLKNIGACTWTSAYAVVFVSGNAMNAPTSVPLSGNVLPGQEVDVAVNMQAPATPGAYTGTWTLRNASGVLFGLGLSNGPFYIVINVVAPTATATATSSGPILHLPIQPLPIHLFGTSQVVAQVTAPASGIGHAVVNCPSGSVVTGGGFKGNSNLLVTDNSATGNGWNVYAQNLSASAQPLSAYAECLVNSSGTITQVVSQSTIAANTSGSAVAACPSGSVLTGGGFAGSTNLSIFTTLFNSSGWVVAATNNSASNQLLNSYAICLSGTSGSTQQVFSQVSVPANSPGHVLAACPSGSYLTGGGYAGIISLSVFTETASGSSWEVDSQNTAGSASLSNSYALCLTLP